MQLPEFEVYALTKLGRNSYQGYLKQNGQKIVLKRTDAYADPKVPLALHQMILAGIPYVIGKTTFQSTEWIIQSWLYGQAFSGCKLNQSEVIEFVQGVLELINELEEISRWNWFFADLKADHILRDTYGQWGLIDFEDVILSENSCVAWQDYPSLGGAASYCSDERKSVFLSKNQHQYALALIALGLFLKKPAAELTKRDISKALSALPQIWQERFVRALNSEGFEPDSEQLQLAADCQTAKKSEAEGYTPLVRVMPEGIRQRQPDLIIEKRREGEIDPYTITIFLP